MTHEPTIPIAVRLPPDLVAAVDAFAQRMTSENQYGVRFSRTDALRALLNVAVSATAEPQNANPKPAKAGK